MAAVAFGLHYYPHLIPLKLFLLLNTIEGLPGGWLCAVCGVLADRGFWAVTFRLRRPLRRNVAVAAFGACAW